MRASQYVLAGALCVTSGCSPRSLAGPSSTTPTVLLPVEMPSREGEGAEVLLDRASAVEAASDAPYHWMAPVTLGACRPLPSWGLSGRRAPQPYRYAADVLRDEGPAASPAAR